MRKKHSRQMLCATLLGATAVHAQQVAPAGDNKQMQAVTVVGTSIKGSKITTALPVTMVTTDEIAATGAVDGDDLMRQIPQVVTCSLTRRTKARPGCQTPARIHSCSRVRVAGTSMVFQS